MGAGDVTNFNRGRNKAKTEKEQIVIIEKVFKSKYLRALDVEAPFIGTVEGVEMQLFDDGKKPVLTLDSGQMVVLNRTRPPRWPPGLVPAKQKTGMAAD